tara:strand:+ start:6897 stop:7073 length:177 start_codon:yes stop_codon:yes gene_type:complete
VVSNKISRDGFHQLFCHDWRFGSRKPLFAVAWGIWSIYIANLRSKKKIKELDKEQLIL